MSKVYGSVFGVSVNTEQGTNIFFEIKSEILQIAVLSCVIC